ncbi:hypothetical protein EAO70_29255 [Streptomyces sp. adm13(2018)]|uniref:hypothetical protein n=1 Tax=Streptomyces sp. adm13(2018) TaxID=2479007 RepID=UPI0011CDB47F|nr:hypothetical protein [Streptomyces sp. adm13(2018)]TXS11073.1 hypothetical protein EAO70_29255 [Streptomyces sp. adm13(2018)]
MPERQSTDDNNPFAPPPEGRPDQPWQPRRPDGPDGPDEESSGSGSSGPSDGRWSPRQPGRSDDGFGRGPERQGGGPGGPEGGPGKGGGQGGGRGLRWDPKDPAQRRARYAILAGMWAFFFAVFEIPELALLLGALGLYWAISSLRAKPAPAGGMSPTSQSAGGPASHSSGQTQGQAPGQAPGQPAGRPSGQGATAAPLRSMRTAAISGLVAASVALMIVAVGFTMQVVYRDFYECRDDALTHAGQLACNDLLPKPLRAGFGVRE